MELPLRLGGYRLDEVAMDTPSGPVLLGVHEGLDRRVVVFMAHPGFTERLRRMAPVLARMQHPSMVKVFDLVEHDTGLALVNEFLDGAPLSAMEPADVSLLVALRVCASVARGLEELHANGFIHRAVAPHNIVLTRSGRAVLVDFSAAAPAGVDALTASGLVWGEPPFMAPEQWWSQANQVDVATDIWGLGATLYALICGVPPLGAGQPLNRATAEHIAAQAQAPTPVDLAPVAERAPQPVLDVVARCLQKAPGDRFPSAGAAADALDLAAVYVESHHSGRAMPIAVGGSVLLHLDGGRFRTLEVRERLGEGTHAEVFRVRDPVLGEDLALKALRQEWSSDASLVQRFAREARILTRLDHPNVVQLRFTGLHGRRHVIGLELLTEGTLADHPPATLTEAMTLLAGVLDGLAHAHALGVVHRDVKPGNIALVGDRPVLVDFGISRLGRSGAMTHTGAVLGSPAYMSPEQARGEPVGPAADVYGAGVVAFELLTSHRPHPDASMASMLADIGTIPAPSVGSVRPDLDPALVEAIDAMLRFSPHERPGAAEAAATLRGWMTSPVATWVGD